MLTIIIFPFILTKKNTSYNYLKSLYNIPIKKLFEFDDGSD